MHCVLWLVVESVKEKGEEKEKNPSAAGVENMSRRWVIYHYYLLLILGRSP
jgi:hypothetical protein